MYFSRISLVKNTLQATRSVHRLLRTDAYDHHQLLWNFFPSRPDDKRDFLFRFLESEAQFYLLSSHRPKGPDDGWEVQTKAFEPVIVDRMRLRFDLRANPVVTHLRDGKQKRDDIIMHAKKQLLLKYGLKKWNDLPVEHRPPLYELVKEEGTRWLEGVGRRCGFSVQSNDLSVDAYLQHRLEVKKGSIRYSTIDFSGILKVSDSENFKTALFKGIGPAKGFGCGLLLVRGV